MKASDILYKRNLKRTSCREGIIDIMLKAKKALSEEEISQKLSGNYDRTTFYRSFKTLVEHKIVHKIVVDNLFVKYALDNSITNKKHHAHFYCNSCQSVKCLDSVNLRKIKLPGGYSESETDILVKGECADCNIKSVKH